MEGKCSIVHKVQNRSRGLIQDTEEPFGLDFSELEHTLTLFLSLVSTLVFPLTSYGTMEGTKNSFMKVVVAIQISVITSAMSFSCQSQLAFTCLRSCTAECLKSMLHLFNCCRS